MSERGVRLIEDEPVLTLEDEVGISHACVLCDELVFEGFEVVGSEDLAELRRLCAGVQFAEQRLCALRVMVAQAEAEPVPLLRASAGVTSRHEVTVRRLRREQQLVLAALERARNEQRWIVAGRPSRAPALNLWD